MDYHVPVLLQKSTQMLITNKTGTYFDATIGFGGHASNFLSHLNKNAKLLATDKDVEAYNFCEKKFSNDDRVTVFNTGFTDIKTISLVEKIDGYDGIFADLGVSSHQLDNPESGFTYREEAELDLRMNKYLGNPAHKFLNSADAIEIANVIYNYGEERNSKRIANNIVERRKIEPIKTTLHLKLIIQKSVPVKHLNKTLSRVFQALRILVNNELDELKDFLKKSLELLKVGGRLIILSYHSLEDRIVKDFFRYEALSCVCPVDLPVCSCGKISRLKVLTKKPLVPEEEEIKSNPRSRSVKLRAAEKI